MNEPDPESPPGAPGSPPSNAASAEASSGTVASAASPPVESAPGMAASARQVPSTREPLVVGPVKALTGLAGAVTALLLGLVSLRQPLCELLPRLPLCPPKASSAAEHGESAASGKFAEPAAPAGQPEGSKTANLPVSSAAAAQGSPLELTVRVRRKGRVVDGALVTAGGDQCSTVAGTCTVRVALPGAGGLRLEAIESDGPRTLSASIEVARAELLAPEPNVTLELERAAALTQDVVVRVWKDRAGQIQTDDVVVQVVGGTDQQQCSTHDRGSCTLPQVDTDRSGALELQVVHGGWSGISSRAFDELRSDPRMEIVVSRGSGSSARSPSGANIAPCLTRSQVLEAMRSCLHRPGLHTLSVSARAGTPPRIEGAGAYESCLSQALGVSPPRCSPQSLKDITLVR